MALGESFPSILEAARLGAEWAWAAIYRDLAPGILGYLRARGAAEPDDVTGEVFLRVVRDLDRFQGDESAFRSWAFAIAHHRMIDERRSRSRRREEPVPREVLDGKAPRGNLEAEAMETLGTQEVRLVIESLSPDQRDVLILRILGGLTVEEVAGAVGKAPGAVKALQHRGVAAIRRAISKQAVPFSGPPAVTGVRWDTTSS